MTLKTSFNLDDQSATYLRGKVASGRYANASEVVREALRKMAEEDERHRAELAMLDDAEASGLDPRSHDEIWQSIGAKRGIKL
jgi:antitoxin ParD1/3/4